MRFADKMLTFEQKIYRQCTGKGLLSIFPQICLRLRGGGRGDSQSMFCGRNPSKSQQHVSILKEA